MGKSWGKTSQKSSKKYTNVRKTISPIFIDKSFSLRKERGLLEVVGFFGQDVFGFLAFACYLGSAASLEYCLGIATKCLRLLGHIGDLATKARGVLN